MRESLTVSLYHADVDLYDTHSVLENVLQVLNNFDPQKTIAVPDTHGHPLKLFLFALFSGIVNLNTEEEKENFKVHYKNLIDAYNEKDDQAFYEKLNQFSINIDFINQQSTLPLLRLIGDTLCDRAKGGDHLTLALYRWLKEKNISWEELFSNHNAGALALYHHLKKKSEEEQKQIMTALSELIKPLHGLSDSSPHFSEEKATYRKTANELNSDTCEAYQNHALKGMNTLAGRPILGILPPQGASTCYLIEKAKDHPNTLKKFMDDMENIYIPKLKLISYDHIGTEFKLYSHTIIGILTIIKTAIAFEVSLELIQPFLKDDEKTPTIEELKILIAAINGKFTTFATGNEKPNKDQSKYIRRVTWGRGITEKEIASNNRFSQENNLTTFVHVFGHLGSHPLYHLSEDYCELTDSSAELSFSKNLSDLNCENKECQYVNIDGKNLLCYSEDTDENYTMTYFHFHPREKKAQETEEEITLLKDLKEKTPIEIDDKKTIKKSLSTEIYETERMQPHLFQILKPLGIGFGLIGAGLILTGVGELTKQTLMFTAVSGFLLAHAAPPVLIGTGCALLVFTIAIAVYCYQNQQKSNQIKTVLRQPAKESLDTPEGTPPTPQIP